LLQIDNEGGGEARLYLNTTQVLQNEFFHSIAQDHQDHYSTRIPAPPSSCTLDSLLSNE
jgi:hypothetical protein